MAPRSLEALLHLIERAVEGRLLPAEGTILRQAIVNYDTKVRHYELLLKNQLENAVAELENIDDQSAIHLRSRDSS